MAYGRPDGLLYDHQPVDHRAADRHDPVNQVLMREKGCVRPGLATTGQLRAANDFRVSRVIVDRLEIFGGDAEGFEA